jgi:hypothetical protein
MTELVIDEFYKRTVGKRRTCRVATWYGLVGRSVVTELSEAINLDEIAVGLPRGIHDVTARQVAEAPDRIALVENGHPGVTEIWTSALEKPLPFSPRLESERATG